jgi:hypothetical protein
MTAGVVAKTFVREAISKIVLSVRGGASAAAVRLPRAVL